MAWKPAFKSCSHATIVDIAEPYTGQAAAPYAAIHPGVYRLFSSRSAQAHVAAAWNTTSTNYDATLGAGCFIYGQYACTAARTFIHPARAGTGAAAPT